MKNLTKEEILSFPNTCYGRMLGKQLSNQVVGELLQYKQLEEQLGCPLDVLIKLLVNGELWCESDKMKFDYYDSTYDNPPRKWEDRFICETEPTFFDFDDENLGETEFWANYRYCRNGSAHIVLKLNDYGKIWWLKKDKSE